MPDITTNVSGLIINDGQIYNVYNGATVDGSELISGNLQAYTVGGNATIKNITVTGGSMLVRRAGNVLDTITLSNGVLYLQAGGSAVNLDIRGGTVNADRIGWGGGYMSAVRISAGDVWLDSGTSAHDVMFTGGALYIYGGATVDGITYSGGTLNIFSGATIGNLTKTAAAALNLKDGMSVNNLTLNNGWADVSAGARVRGGIVNTPNGMVVRNGGMVENVAMQRGQIQVQDGGSLTSATVNAGVLNISAAATVSEVTQNGGTLNIAAAATVGGFTYKGGTLNIGSGATFDGLTADATMTLQNGVTVNGLTADATVNLKTGVTVNDLTMNTGWADVSAGARVNGGTLNTANGTVVRDGALVRNVELNAGQLQVQAGGTLSGATINAGVLNISAGAIVNDLTKNGGPDLVLRDGQAISNFVLNKGWTTVSGGALIKGGKFDTPSGVVVHGRVEDVELASGQVQMQSGVWSGGSVTGGTMHLSYRNGAAVSGLTVKGGTLNIFYTENSGADLTLSDGTIRLINGAAVSRVEQTGGNFSLFDLANLTGQERDAITADAVIVSGGTAVLRGTNVSGSDITLRGGEFHVQNGAAVTGVVVSGGTFEVWQQSNPLCVDHDVAQAFADQVDVLAGGSMVLASGGFVSAGTLRNGAEMTICRGAGAELAAAEAGARIAIDFSGEAEDPGAANALVTGWDRIAAGAAVTVGGLDVGHEYVLGDAANTALALELALDWGLYYRAAIDSADSYTNPFMGAKYSYVNGRKIAAEGFSIGAAKATAGAITTADTALNTNDRAAKWDASTACTGSVTLADSTLAGDVWLEIDGTDVASALYGATGYFSNTVNLYAKSGTIRNLAAGAEAGGSVGAVKLTVDGAEFSGTAYAGGFGSVTGATETLVANGTFAKDFYAGALANYAKTGELTDVGDVSLTVEGGSFAGNLYGASAVKAGGATTVVHAVGDVTLTIAGGNTTKADFCCFAGGYATGTSNATVYTVGNIDAAISDGYWGEARGGRGFFGGAFASGVKAEAGDVNLTIEGGTMGNVYGGGWAQKNGTSTVGNVAISISGGTVANVFGGGSHSTSGGTTEAGDVTITVSCGDISGAIYARGQLDGDTVASAEVIFTGANDYACNVYGYSYVGAAEASDATLTFAGYTGEFAGEIGGFDSIEFNDGTAMTLATAAANVANSAWKFDVAARSEALASTAMLNWSAADFSGDTIALNLATGSTAEWTLVDAAATTVYNKFDVLVDEVSQGTLALGEQIVDGDYKGWGFAVEDSALKFKNLA